MKMNQTKPQGGPSPPPLFYRVGVWVSLYVQGLPRNDEFFLFFVCLFACLFCFFVGCCWRVYIKGYKTNGSSKSSGRIVTTRVRDGVDGRAGRLQEDTWYSRTDQYLHYAIS